MSNERLAFFDAAGVLFDLDGVITPTAEVHMRAWSTMFTELFTARGRPPAVLGRRTTSSTSTAGPATRASPGCWHRAASTCRWGDPSDPDDAETVCGIGNRKNAVFSALLEAEGIAAYPGSLAVLDRLGALGIPVAIVSSSKNAVAVLAAAHLADRFPVIVDGVVAQDEGLPGKPRPDIFLAGAERLQVDPANAVVVEDAISGVAAGAAGNFGLVVGVDRGVGSEALRDAGADLVVGDLADLLAEQKGALAVIDRDRFPVDEWKLVERIYSDERMGLTETIFTVANGYLGMRGNSSEGRDAHEHGTFINGFHEVWPIRHAEQAYGFAEVGQTIVNVPDTKIIRLYVDDEPLVLDVAELLTFERELDFRDGVLRRELLWLTPSGKRVRVKSDRMVSFVERHLAVMSFEVTVENADATVVLSSQILNRQDGEDEFGRTIPGAQGSTGFDPRRAERLAERVLQPVEYWQQGDRSALSFRVTHSHMTMSVVTDHVVETENEVHMRPSIAPDIAKNVYQVRAKAGVPVQADQDRGVPHVPQRAPARAHRPRPAAARPRARLRRRRAASAAARVARRLLGAQRRRDRGAAPDAAGGPLEPVHARAGGGPRGLERRPGEGPHGQRLQRPLLLGHRDLRDAVPHVHQPPVRAERAEDARADAARGPQARAAAERGRRAVPVAHDQRRGGVGLLRGRHRAVPHQRRRDLRHREVRARHRRRRLPRPRRDRHGRGDRAALDDARVLAAHRGQRRSTSTASPAPTSTRRSSTTTSSRT